MANGAEVTCAQKHRDLVVFTVGVQRIQHLEPGETQVLGHAVGDLVVAIVEQIGVVFDRLAGSVINHIDRHLTIEQKSHRGKLDFKRQSGIPPQAFIRPEADVAVLVVIQIF